MKRILTLICSTFVAAASTVMCGFQTKNVTSDNLVGNCKSAYLIDYNSGECIYKHNETARMPIASVCKVMTLTLCMEALNSEKISLDDKVTVSEKASGMGGSQVFLGTGCEYTVDQLLKSIVVCSANDSCVAMSETVAGSEESFVALMNKKAAELGCNDTLFANCTGLPKPQQYSCAHDVALMFKNLIQYENYFNYSKVWLEDFIHPDNRTTCMTNTNKLIKKYSLCDGGKTGFTNEAGFCLAATAKKDSMRLVSAVLGADSSDDRFASTVNMFNYGFANYKNKIVLDKDVTLNDEFKLVGGRKKSFSVCPERNVYVFSANDKTPDITHNVYEYKVKAPVQKGQVVGKIEIFKDGVLCDTVNVVSAEDVKKANFANNFTNVSDNWAL